MILAAAILGFTSGRAAPVSQAWSITVDQNTVIDAEGHYVLTTESDPATTRLLDADSGKELRTLPSVSQAKFAGGRLLTAALDASGWMRIEILNLRTMRKEATVRGGLGTCLGGVSGNDLFYADSAGLHRYNLLRKKFSQTRTWTYPDEVFEPKWVGVSGGFVSWQSGGHEFAMLRKSNFKRGWRYYINPYCLVMKDGQVFGVTILWRLFHVAADGTLHWLTQRKGDFVMCERTTPVVANGLVVIPGHPYRRHGSYLYGISMSTGKPLWRQPARAERVVPFGNDFLCDGSEETVDTHFVEVRSIDGGKLKWRSARLAGRPAAIASTPNRFYVVAGGKLTCFKRT